MKELTYEDWQKNPTPRMMWVWDDDVSSKRKLKVVYFTGRNYYPVITVSKYGCVDIHKHCAEIEGPKYRRMTNRELSRWIRENPTREFMIGSRHDNNLVSYLFEYCVLAESNEVDKDILIRENGGEWHEPLMEVEE